MRLERDVQPEALRRFREDRGLTHEQLAEIAWASPLEVAAWEAGTVRVPREQARRIRQRELKDRWDAAVISAALLRCEWADTHAPSLHATLRAGPVDLRRLDPEVRLHLEGCPTCRRVHDPAYGLWMLQPDPGLGSDLPETLGRLLNTTPRILLYPVLIAGGTAAWVGGALLFQRLVPRAVQEGLAADTGLALIWAGSAFALAGTFLMGRLRRRPYLRGMLASAAGVLAGVAAWNVLDPVRHPLTTPVVLGGALLTIAGGLLAGRWNRWKGDVGDDSDPAADAGLPEPSAYPRLQDGGVGEMDVAPPGAQPVRHPERRG